MYLSPAEKYDLLNNDDNYTLTKEAWDVFESYSDYEYNWNWMGLCHGWAKASYLEEKPKHAVQVENENGVKILFTEGDIRGLVTKAYATNRIAGKTSFIGRRCEAKGLEYDEIGRVVDGVVYEDEFDENGELVKSISKKIFIVKNNWHYFREIHFKYGFHSDDEHILSVFGVDEDDPDIFKVKIYSSIEDYRNKVNFIERRFQYLKNCRDLNPATLHLAFYNRIKKMEKIFVLDINGKNQVWNHPTYGYKSKLLSTIEDSADDPRHIYRAPGTTKVYNFETQIHYSTENGPLLTFDKGDDHKGTRFLRYSLEVNEDGIIIGGEWSNKISTVDFLWTQEGDLLDSDLVKYSLIKKILKCSVSSDELFEIEVNSTKIKYSKCEI
jgi:hypothetical protein